MKYANLDLTGPREELLVIPRGDQDLIFKAKIVSDYSEFQKLCPEPIPRQKLLKGQTQAIPDLEDPEYKTKKTQTNIAKFNWCILQSLSATPDLKWETIDPVDSETWGNWRQELLDAKFNSQEIDRILGIVVQVNSCDDTRLEEAKKRFLTGKSDPANT